MWTCRIASTMQYHFGEQTCGTPANAGNPCYQVVISRVTASSYLLTKIESRWMRGLKHFSNLHYQQLLVIGKLLERD
jgi:hypothetical protein